jgi:hypothetical protein
MWAKLAAMLRQALDWIAVFRAQEQDQIVTIV